MYSTNEMTMGSSRTIFLVARRTAVHVELMGCALASLKTKIRLRHRASCSPVPFEDTVDVIARMLSQRNAGKERHK